MRVKIGFKTVPGFKIPYNNNYTVASIIYSALEDQSYATNLHDSRGFKYFTFSQVQIPRLQIEPDGLISKDGRFYVLVSSVSDEFIRNLWHGLFQNPIIDFHGTQVGVEKVEILEKPEFTGNMSFKTLSPILMRTTRDGKTWDLPAGSPQFWDLIKDNLLKKYEQILGSCVNTDIEIEVENETIKQKRIIIKKGDIEIYHRSYQLRFTMKADPKLQEFAYDMGIGGKTGMGFGMLGLF